MFDRPVKHTNDTSERKAPPGNTCPPKSKTFENVKKYAKRIKMSKMSENIQNAQKFRFLFKLPPVVAVSPGC